VFLCCVCAPPLTAKKTLSWPSTNGVGELPATAGTNSSVFLRLVLCEPNVTMTIMGPDTGWFGVGFGAKMTSAEAIVYSTGKTGKQTVAAMDYALTAETFVTLGGLCAFCCGMGWVYVWNSVLMEWLWKRIKNGLFLQILMLLESERLWLHGHLFPVCVDCVCICVSWEKLHKQMYLWIFFIVERHKKHQIIVKNKAWCAMCVFVVTFWVVSHVFFLTVNLFAVRPTTHVQFYNDGHEDSSDLGAWNQ